MIYLFRFRESFQSYSHRSDLVGFKKERCHGIRSESND